MKPTVIFVGDKPSGKNFHPAIPFLGTQSGKRLVEWLKYLNYSPVAIINQSQEGFETFVIANRNLKYVALGRVAEKRLRNLRIDHFYLPHPSGRNRQLNDKTYVDSILHNCYVYLHDRFPIDVQLIPLEQYVKETPR